MEPGVLRQLLATYSIEMPTTALVKAADAVATAEAMGYPVAIKALRRRVGHSVESGVALNLDDASDVADAVATMVAHLGPDAAEVYVQPMKAPGVDLRVKASDDPTIGPIVAAGLGGVKADIIADEEIRLAPVSPSVARSMIGSTRAAALLDDDDTDRASQLVGRISHMVASHPEIAELDLNPVSISDQGVSVLDASIVLRPSDRTPSTVRRLE
ncbi:MAG: hypothetical protein CSA55_02165 [Ilumatobacter coccineus]|uniref:ATP-grasp domain-containing protein n=1 Tax=Ilumatobacter coccineus TaxID=467094 RepID=A0A2G6KC25_9ACTN|nr:MAG: hypothetical protein CSA55_02165 [Ilumatobacter coccineus]